MKLNVFRFRNRIRNSPKRGKDSAVKPQQSEKNRSFCRDLAFLHRKFSAEGIWNSHSFILSDSKSEIHQRRIKIQNIPIRNRDRVEKLEIWMRLRVSSLHSLGITGKWKLFLKDLMQNSFLYQISNRKTDEDYNICSSCIKKTEITIGIAQMNHISLMSYCIWFHWKESKNYRNLQSLAAKKALKSDSSWKPNRWFDAFVLSLFQYNLSRSVFIFLSLYSFCLDHRNSAFSCKIQMAEKVKNKAAFTHSEVNHLYSKRMKPDLRGKRVTLELE